MSRVKNPSATDKSVRDLPVRATRLPDGTVRVDYLCLRKVYRVLTFPAAAWPKTPYDRKHLIVNLIETGRPADYLPILADPQQDRLADSAVRAVNRLLALPA